MGRLICSISIKQIGRKGSQSKIQAWQAGMQSCDLLISGVSAKPEEMKAGAIQVYPPIQHILLLLLMALVPRHGSSGCVLLISYARDISGRRQTCGLTLNLTSLLHSPNLQCQPVGFMASALP